MKKSKKYTVKLKRKVKTNYKKRLKFVLSKKLRLVIRPKLNNIITQIVEYNPNGDIILVDAQANHLKKYGWKLHTGNMPSAYLTGLLIGVKAKKKNITEAIVDFGVNSVIKYSRLYAVVKGALDAGLKIPHSKEVLPKDDKITGESISNFLSNLDSKKYPNQFSNYLKNNIKHEDIVNHFNEIKNKILKENG